MSRPNHGLSGSRVNLTMTPDLERKLAGRAAELRVPKNVLVRAALKEFLNIPDERANYVSVSR